MVESPVKVEFGREGGMWNGNGTSRRYCDKGRFAKV